MKKKSLIAFTALCFIGIIVWAIIVKKDNVEFWNIAFYDIIMLVITLILGVVVAYFLPEQNNRKRFFDTAFMSKVCELKEFLKNECRQSVMFDFFKQDFRSEMLSNSKILDNKIALLMGHNKNKKVISLLQQIKDQYIEYKTITTEYYDSLKQQEYREKAVLKIDLMIGKLDEIELILSE